MPIIEVEEEVEVVAVWMVQEEPRIQEVVEVILFMHLEPMVIQLLEFV